MPVRLSKPLVALAVVATLATSVAVTGAAQPATTAEDVANTALSDYGPTKKAPKGAKLPPLQSRNRWKYIGTLGKLGNNEQVVKPAIDAPETPDRVAPLTGKKSKKKSLSRPARVVKIDNVAAARPQTGINQADIVYEELVEAGATRLAAVFHSKSPSIIGPVRSARSTDIGIAVSYNRPIFANSGANSIVERLVARARLYDRGDEVTSGVYYRRGGRAPHNLYTSTARLLNTVDGGKAPKAQFAYRNKNEDLAADVPAAQTIQLRYERNKGSAVRYEWDAKLGGYRRYQGGTPHRDSAGVQVAPENVVVQIVDYVDAGMTDKFGLHLYEAQMVGKGEAFIFTNGRVVEATWTKPTLRSVTTFTDTDGNHVELTKGRTWVALVPPDGGFTFYAMRCKGQLATIAGTDGDDVLVGTDQRDVIAGGNGADEIVAGGGNDLVCGGKGDDVIFGDEGNDRLFGLGGADYLRGGDGNDFVNAGSGNDNLGGDDGVDDLRGKGGADQIYAQPDEDSIRSTTDDAIVRGR